MIKLFIFLRLILFYNFKKFSKNNNRKENNELKGIYRISFLNNNHFFIFKNSLILSEQFSLFNIIKVESNSFLIENRKDKKLLASDENNKLKLIRKNKNININKILWKIIKINKKEYTIQSQFKKKFIGVSNEKFLVLINFENNKLIKKNILFNFLKFFEEENQLSNYKMINNEQVDIIIKYIDTTDKTLNRTGINQIYKDQDNEELRYSIRSILLNIPWVRKIFILMPNEKVRFLKSKEEIGDKIIFVKDKDLLGYDSANNVAFLFNLYKMEKFGISKNFIYMDDDYFFGKSLKKSDFFYYDEKEKKVYPYILAYKFKEMNKTEELEKYYKLFEIKNLIHPHSGEGFQLSILCTEKFFIEKFNYTLITIEFTHNAIAENIDDLKEIFELIQEYKYINETLLSKERYILRLNQHYFFNLYQLNIKKKKVHSILHKYFKMEAINKFKLDIPLFVINTGGNHIPLKRQYKFQKKIMEKKFGIHNKYEIFQIKKKRNNINYFYIIRGIIIFIFIKIYKKQ